MKKLILFLSLIALSFNASAQTIEELKTEQAAKKDSIAAIQSRVNAIQAQIDAMPGWRVGAFGTIGGSL